MNINSSIVRILLGVGVFLAAAIALSTPYVNEDLFLAFAAGRDISQGIVAVPDHWSFTAEGRVWINQAWLSHYLLYLAHEYLGPTGPVALKVFLFASCVILVLLRCMRLGADSGTSLAALIPGILASGPFLGIRPENFGLLFFLLFTTLLTAETLPKWQRRFGVPTVMTVWSNFHGSFMVGLAFLWIKCLLVTWRSYRNGSPSRTEAAEWWLTSVFSTILSGLLSPFGMDNLFMPFKQVGTRAVTEYSADWLPLLSFDHLDQGLLGGGSVYPYLILLGLLIVSMGISFRLANRQYFRNVRADVVMEIVIALVTVVMAFRFRRLVLFSALSLVPLLAAIIQSTKDVLKRAGTPGLPSESQPDLELSRSEQPGHVHSGRASLISVAAASVCLAILVVLSWRAAVVPYLPNNPFRPERPVMRELMSFDSFSEPLVRFIRMNGIGETNLGEKFLVGWELSPYLLQAVPQIKVFMDCRDQSIYPDRVATDYFTIMGVITADGRDPLALLDHYGVTNVAVTTNPIDLQAAIRLMRSRKWACIYADPDSILMVRTDSARFKEALQTDLKGLWFPDEESRTLSRALLSYFLYGRIQPETLEDLKAVARSNPWPDLYVLIVWGMDENGSCFNARTVNYLVTEASRLSEIDPLRDKRGAQILESLTRIHEILQLNAFRCGDPEIAGRFESLKEDSQRKYEHLRARFLGRFF
ncbi:MAG: hypothetical protein HY912_13155 [Desulfomonile tiedjei]|uniref:Uncharacterized protein n=1 Tax=Desulfomonile tiedjei TaxID=2358 RepID=A0A9D6V4F5_9BACT|nr:hypothetical protein [Desulfomonile tiedjei]